MTSPLRFLLLLLATVLTTTSCSSDAALPQDASVPEVQAKDFWEPLRNNGDEVEGFGSIQEMHDSADLVVEGTIVSYEIGRTIQGDVKEDVVTYASAAVATDTSVSGLVPEDLVVEFLVIPDGSGAAATIERQRVALPNGSVLLYLREKSGAESGRFRLVNSTGL